MIPVATRYDNMVAAGAQYRWQIRQFVGDGTVRLCDYPHIVSGTIHDMLFSNLSVGNCYAKELTLTLWDYNAFTKDKPIFVEFRAHKDGESDSAAYAKGKFVIDSIRHDSYNNITEIVAYDPFVLLDQPYCPDGVYVQRTLTEIAEYIATAIGCGVLQTTKDQLDALDPYFSITNEMYLGQGGTSMRDVLSLLGVIACGNWVISGDSNMKLIYAVPTDTANVGDAFSSLSVYDAEEYTKARVWCTDEIFFRAPSNITLDAWYALAGKAIEVKTPYDYSDGAALVANLYNTYKNKTYYPFTATNVYIDPKYEVGDGITFGVANPITSIIADLTTTISPLAPADIAFEAAPEETYCAPGSTSSQTTTSYQIGQLDSRLTAAETALGISGIDFNISGDMAIAGVLNVVGKINGIAFNTALIDSGTSKTFTVPSGSRHFIVVSGTVTARQAAYIVGCSTTGAVGVTNLAQGSSITSSTGTNSLTIGTSGGSASVMITTFSGSPITFS